MPTTLPSVTDRDHRPKLGTVERSILRLLDEVSPVCLDDLIQLLPEFTWNQVFQAIDGLARAGQVLLQRHRSTYHVLATDRAIPHCHMMTSKT